MKLAGYFSRGLFQHLGKDWNTIRRDLVRRSRHANRGDNFSLTVQKWHADAANANYTFFIIQGVPKLPHVVEFTFQTWDCHDSVIIVPGETAYSDELGKPPLAQKG